MFIVTVRDSAPSGPMPDSPRWSRCSPPRLWIWRQGERSAKFVHCGTGQSSPRCGGLDQVYVWLGERCDGVLLDESLGRHVSGCWRGRCEAEVSTRRGERTGVPSMAWQLQPPAGLLFSRLVVWREVCEVRLRVAAVLLCPLPPPHSGDLQVVGGPGPGAPCLVREAGHASPIRHSLTGHELCPRPVLQLYGEDGARILSQEVLRLACPPRRPYSPALTGVSPVTAAGGSPHHLIWQLINYILSPQSLPTRSQKDLLVLWRLRLQVCLTGGGRRDHVGCSTPSDSRSASPENRLQWFSRQVWHQSFPPAADSSSGGCPGGRADVCWLGGRGGGQHSHLAKLQLAVSSHLELLQGLERGALALEERAPEAPAECGVPVQHLLTGSRWRLGLAPAQDRSLEVGNLRAGHEAQPLVCVGLRLGWLRTA